MAEAVCAFFSSTLKESSPPDDALEAYLVEVLAAPDDDSVVETVCDLLASMSAYFAALPDQERGPLVLQLHQQVQDELARATSKPDVPKALQALSLNTLSQPPGSTVAGTSGVACADCLSKASSASEQEEPGGQVSIAQACAEVQEDMWARDVEQLGEVCGPEITQPYLEHLLLSCRGLQPAVEFVLELGDDLTDHHRAWVAAIERAAREATAQRAEEARAKKRVIARFDLQPVPVVGPPNKAQHKALMTFNGAGEGGGSKVRYREGMVVTSRGEKYIHEATKDEWDGGSRGKVYTKGKRGKGFM